MKKTLFILAAAAMTLTALAALPTFKTTSASGTTAAIAYFPADPNSQIRVVNYSATSDNATGQVYFATGQGAYYQTLTNAASSSVTNFVNTTNGLTANANVLLQHAGACYPATIASTGSNTLGFFIVLGSGGWASVASVNDDIFVMTNNVTLANGNTTVTANGEAIYVGNYGRPVAIKVTGASSCALNSASAHYDSQSQ